MISAVMIVAIVSALGTIILTTGTHADRSSQRGKNWEASLATAEAGVQQAIAYLQSTNGATPIPFTGVTTEGAYTVDVTYLGRNRYQIDSTGSAGKSPGLTAGRSVRVVMAPPRTFRYALFSLSDVDTKNNNHVVGDVWANGSVTVYQNDTIEGSVNAATGWLTMANNSTITGNVVSGGFNPASSRAIDMGNGAHIGGTAIAASSNPGCGDDPSGVKYQVNVGGSISGATTTWGIKTGSGSTGTLLTHVCKSAPATKTIPVYSFNPVNYSPAPQVFTSPAAFSSWLSTHSSNLSGTFYIKGGGASSPVDINGVTIGGDTTIIAESAPINAFGGVGVSSGNSNDKVFVLASYYQPAPGSVCTSNGGNPADCAIGIKNNFAPNDGTATLLYAPNGPVSFKNNADFLGAVYANSITIKNNMNITYDERVDQLVGFGEFTLEPESWVEST